MSKRTGKKYTDEVKDEAVKLITEQGYSITEAARNLGVTTNLLGRRKKESEQPTGEPSSSGDTVAAQAELKRLRKENKQLKMEREILQKEATFFAKEQELDISLSIPRRRLIQSPYCAKSCKSAAVASTRGA